MLQVNTKVSNRDQETYYMESIKTDKIKYKMNIEIHEDGSCPRILYSLIPTCLYCILIIYIKLCINLCYVKYIEEVFGLPSIICVIITNGDECIHVDNQIHTTPPYIPKDSVVRFLKSYKKSNVQLDSRMYN